MSDMSTNVKIVRRNPEPVREKRSPQREELAQTILRVQLAEQRIERIRSLSHMHLIPTAEDRVLECERLVAEAQAREPERLVSELLGDTHQPWPSLAEVEADLAEARTNLKLAQRTRAALDVERRQADAELETATRARRKAIQEVVRAEGGIDKLLAQFEVSKRELAKQQELLTWLYRNQCVPEYWDKVRSYPPSEAPTSWQIAFLDLEQNPDAELPRC